MSDVTLPVPNNMRSRPGRALAIAAAAILTWLAVVAIGYTKTNGLHRSKGSRPSKWFEIRQDSSGHQLTPITLRTKN